MHCNSVLIAEDNDDIRELLEDVLVSEGYVVHTAKNGREALEKLKTIPAPTLVLLDLMMPVMSGWEFLDAQKNNAVLAPYPVVVISAVAATQSLQDATPLNTAGSIQKPIPLGPLLETVRKFCGPVETAPVADGASAAGLRKAPSSSGERSSPNQVA